MEVALIIIGGKSRPLILDRRIGEGTRRFSELMREIIQTSQRILTNQLRELESEGLIQRRVYAQGHPRVEYSITPRRQYLESILELMCK